MAMQHRHRPVPYSHAQQQADKPVLTLIENGMAGMHGLNLKGFG